MTTPDGDEGARLNAEVREIWDRNADFWDERMGPEGNDFHRLLVGPPAERLLDIQPGETVLEVACGSGIFARRLADLGARVIATDFSREFLKRARDRSAAYGERIRFQVLDVADRAALESLGVQRFDAVVANMALMDIEDIHPLASALPSLLSWSGRFVCTVLHPCFNSTGCTMLVEQEESGEGIDIFYSVRVKRYLGLGTHKGIGLLGQPAAQYYFHRPLHALMGPFLAAGLMLDGIEEPTFEPSVVGNRQLSWSGNYHEIPPVLALRFRQHNSDAAQFPAH